MISLFSFIYFYQIFTEFMLHYNIRTEITLGYMPSTVMVALAFNQKLLMRGVQAEKV